jgi:hypothetical protein
MSRARPITINGRTHWFDMSQQKAKATDKQLELLAVVEEADLDELLEASVTQAEVLRRLREALGTTVPYEVLVRRQKWRQQRQRQPECRICGKKGDSTRHHFVNKWILRELHGYAQKWANRRENCVPVCIDCHRDLHDRNGTPKSIAHLLTPRERAFAQRALGQLAEERPKLLILLARGDSAVYEAQLVKDWIAGKFDAASAAVAQAA